MAPKYTDVFRLLVLLPLYLPSSSVGLLMDREKRFYASMTAQLKSHLASASAADHLARNKASKTILITHREKKKSNEWDI